MALHPGREARRTAARPALGVDRPLCFLHIAKTGGSSLTDALARLYAPDRVFSDGGNLTAGYLDSLAERLDGGAFLAGHAGQGVAAALMGRADMITLLRNPADQAVSNYLHVLSERHNALHADATRLSFKDYLRRHDHQIDYQARSLAVALGPDPVASDDLRQSPDALAAFLDSLAFVGVMERMEACAQVLSRRLAGGPALSLACLNAAVCRGVSARTLERLRQDYLDLRDDPDLAPIFAREARLHARAETLLARAEADWRYDAAPGPVAAAANFIGPARFHTPQGVTRGARVVAPLNGPGRHIILGPYARLPPGHYEAVFHLHVVAPSPAARGRIKLEAACNGDIRLGRRWLRPAGHAAPRRVTVRFTHDAETDVLEFRIRAKGFTGGRLIFEGVTIRPSSAARAWPSRVWRALSLTLRQARRGIRAARNALAPATNRGASLPMTL